MSWSSGKKKEGIFSTIYFAQRSSFSICILSQCTVYWIHSQNINTFTYQKTLLYTLFCLFLKSSKALSLCILNISSMQLMQGLNTKAFFRLLLGLRQLHVYVHRNCKALGPRFNTCVLFGWCKVTFLYYMCLEAVHKMFCATFLTCFFLFFLNPLWNLLTLMVLT